MKYIEFPLYAEGYINRFITTGVYTKPQQFTKATLSGKINEWLKKGFSIHENPCRKEFIADRQKGLPPYIDISRAKADEEITVFQQDRRMEYYFPFGNIGMEASGFYYTPTYLRSYSYAILKAEKEEVIEFELITCGGLTLWVNDVLISDFTPFTRNMVKSTKVKVPLQQGQNKFIICLDDLAERDTDYYFRIRRVGGSELTIMLPVKEAVALTELAAAERMLEQMSFDKESYFSEPVRLQIRNNLNRLLDLEVTLVPGDFIEKMTDAWKLNQTRQYQMKAEQYILTLFHSDEILPGYYYFHVQIVIGGIVLKRKIGNQIIREEFLKYHEESLKERKNHAMETIIHYGVDNIYKAAVLFKLDRDLAWGEALIREELPGIRQRRDCSDFHLVILLYIYQMFQEKLTPMLKSEIEDTVLNYRYWIDEPGDDVMWFFSENHALLFHICQYIAGAALPEQVFTNSGLIGQRLREKASRLLEEWFEGFFEEFITEWNSNAYIPIDVLGLGTLYNLTAAGDSLHQKAQDALDMIFYCLCINEHKGSLMTSFGRTYEKEMKGNYNAGTTGMLYVAYNAGFLNRGTIGYLTMVLGDYEAPQEYRQYLGLTGSKELIHQNTQGFEKHVNLYLYKNSDVLLSTAVGFKPNQPGYQEHIVQAVINQTAQVFINHPGESHPYGSGRPNFWAGNGCLPMAMQFRDMSIIKYNIDVSNRIDYTHAYIPLSEFSQYRGDTHAIALEKDGGYIGVKALNGLIIQEQGPCRHREFMSPGRENVWILKVARSCEYDSLEAFFKSLTETKISIEEGKAVLVVTGEREYSIDNHNVCRVNGELIYQYPLTVKGKLEFREA